MILTDTEHDVYNASMPALGFVTDGFSVEHAFEMAEVAISVWIDTARDDGVPIPMEDHPAVLRQIAV